MNQQKTIVTTLGQVVATPGALEALERYHSNVHSLLQRHSKGDWGDVCDEDASANDQALKHGGRVLSSYQLSPECKIWIITEWDGSTTTILLPEEY